jgi:hypothetical protein
MNLISRLLSPIRKYAPEVITPFFNDYIAHCEIPGDTTYHYGYGSLKWAIFRIAEIDPNRAVSILFNIMAETIARNIDPETIEHHCYRLFCLTKYRSALRQATQIDVMELPEIKIGNIKAVINDSGRGITGMILRNRPDIYIIISVCEGTPSVISFPFPRFNTIKGKEDLILDKLGQIEGGWTMLNSNQGVTFINRTPEIPGYAHIVTSLQKAFV